MTDTAAPPTAPPTAPPPAPPRKRNRLRYTIVAILCLGAVVWMITLMQKNVVFFKTVSQAVHDQAQDGTRTMRIGGGVIPNSIKLLPNGADFELTAGGVTVTVHHTGDEPELFRACAPVVAQGHWSAPGSRIFDSDQLLIKHGANYNPPKTATQCPPDPFGNNT